MWYFGQQIIAAGDRGWVQLLVFLVMGVLYAVASIKKMNANKIKKDDFPEEEEQPQQQPSMKTAKASFAQLRRGRDAIQQRLDMHGKRPRHAKTAVSAKPKVNIKKPSRQVGSPYERTRAAETAAATPASAVMAAAGLYQMDNLKNAVIYHEILSKPVALRDSEKELAGF